MTSVDSLATRTTARTSTKGPDMTATITARTQG